MLLIGGLYGRILGRIFVDIFGINDDLLDWMDPGAFALLGAVSFFAGVSRYNFMEFPDIFMYERSFKIDSAANVHKSPFPSMQLK